MVEEIVLLMEKQEIECELKYSNVTPPGIFTVHYFGCLTSQKCT